MYRNLKNILPELHVILACDNEHQKMFPILPMTGFKNSKNLRSHLVRAVVNHMEERNLFVTYAVSPKILNSFNNK